MGLYLCCRKLQPRLRSCCFYPSCRPARRGTSLTGPECKPCPSKQRSKCNCTRTKLPREAGRSRAASTRPRPDFITLTLKDGQTRTLEKQAVRKVLTRRPFSKRWPGWVALAIPLLLLELHFSGEPPGAAGRLHGHAITTLPTAAAFFYGSRMKGLYEVPPKHRIRPAGGQQSGAD